MRWLISPGAMRGAEEKWFRESGVPSIAVMERAAQALADAISGELPEGAAVYFACGTGGNGGDGMACARLLCGRYRCTIVQPRAPRHPDAVANLARARACGIPVYEHAGDLPRPDAWVDALFGTGLSRAPSGAEAGLIERINADRAASGVRVYSADIPSGLNGRTGQAFSPCVRADRTITFQYLKTGLALGDGLDAAGEAGVADVGFPAFPEDVFDAKLLDAGDVARLLPPRPRNIHKGQCGHLLIVAGSLGMAGAAAMCALAALRSGAGLVTVACPASIVSVLQTLAPQAMCVPLEECSGAIAASAVPALREALRGKNAAVVGCGLSRRAAPEAVRAVLESGVPAVVDADALNLLSGQPELLGLLRPHHVLTPHPGEARRLLRAAAMAEGGAFAGRQENCGSGTVGDSARAVRREDGEIRESSESLGMAVNRQREDVAADRQKEDALDELLADPIAAARALNDLGATVLFKGAACTICGAAVGSEGTNQASRRCADGECRDDGGRERPDLPDGDQREVYVSASGGCGMARGGSGDILSGIMGALLAERSDRSPAQSAALASELHGLAGERAQARYGTRAMNARDILEFLPEAFPG